MTRTTGQKNKKSILPEITLTNPQRLVFGSFLVILGVLVFISILSYFLMTHHCIRVVLFGPESTWEFRSNILKLRTIEPYFTRKILN